MTFEEKKELALRVTVPDYLARIGRHPIPGGESGSYIKYHSPIPDRPKEDTTGSFFVKKKDGRWCDYGYNEEWERVIALCMIMEHVNFVEAVNRLCGYAGHSPIVKNYSGVKRTEEQNNRPNVEVVGEPLVIRNSKLVKYVTGRGVDIDIARKYCKQISIRFPNGKYPNGRIKVVGFQNDKGGWAYREHVYKGAVPQTWFTTIGDPMAAERYVFEGFFDFLSFLMDNGITEIEGLVIVLNSLSYMNKDEFKDIMKQPGTNYMFIDNDKSADNKLRIMKDEDIPFEDFRWMFHAYHDYNDKLLNKLIF